MKEHCSKCEYVLAYLCSKKLVKDPFRPSVSFNVATRRATKVILFSLKTVESLENGLQLYFGAIPLLSMRKMLLAPL